MIIVNVVLKKIQWRRTIHKRSTHR